MMAVSDPTDAVEREFFGAGARYVIGCDEVGRGALAGPVAVGMAVLAPDCGPHPDGLRDSKLLSEKRRVDLAPLVSEWVLSSAVGLADAREVDELGIIHCLGLAGKRALRLLHQQGVDIAASVILLDGNSDYLNPFLASPLDVRTRVKADRDCVSVAAASVLAKVHRDNMMIASDMVSPGYGWSGNKGYGSEVHMQAIRSLGVTSLHRKSWLGAYA
ncbi:MAG: Ribonuclease [Mycetocola sp.]|jgi:ribonuclease HII|nr:Ribonuclease [Mycetocola sp.]